MELKDSELEDRKEKLKRELEELFHKLIFVSEDDIGKFDEQEMKKIRPIIRKLFDQLIIQNVMRKKPKIIKDKLKNKIIGDIWRLFDSVKKRKRRNEKRSNIIIDIIDIYVIIDICRRFDNERKRSKGRKEKG